MRDQTFVLDDSFILHRPAMKQSSQAATVQGTAIPTGTTPLIAKGDDGRLEVQVPRGSLDFAHAVLADGSSPVGQLFLRIHQLSGHFLETESILGTYQIQVVDSQGHVVQGVQVLHPITVIYHYQSWEMTDLNLNPDHVHLSWSASSIGTPGQRPTANSVLSPATSTATQPTSTVAPMHNDSSAHTLSAQTSALNTPLTASGTPTIATPGKPDLFETNGNSGQYGYSYPLAVAPGPAGFAPQLQLTYSSQSTNERHSAISPAGDEGEGFSLSLGSITAATYPATSAGGAATWYSINGVDGVSDKLIPIPNQSGFYETQHLTHQRIQFVNNNCWYVWGLDGTFYQLGCTPDSLQKTAAGSYEWDVNEILAPYNSQSQVKTMLISYLQDSPDGGTTIRDAGIKQIQYGFATSAPASSLSLVAGTVDFHYAMPAVPSGQSGFAVAYGTNYNCASTPPSSTTLRCDDPITSNSVNAPSVMPTMSLLSVDSYLGSDSSGNLAYTYSFAYQDQPFTTSYTDPYTQVQESAAGEHLLTQITPTVYVGGTAHQRKPVVFGYASGLQDLYRDPSQKTLNGSQVFSTQTAWSYLNHYEDLTTGEGANITYQTGYSNTNGTPDVTDSSGNVITDRFNPFFCTEHASLCVGAYAHPEDYSWGLQLVSQIAALGTDSGGTTHVGQPSVATTVYHYGLTGVLLSHMPVSTCNPITGSGVPSYEASCTSDVWVPEAPSGSSQKDGDWQDYYHQEYRGMFHVWIVSPSGDVTEDQYLTTEGWWTLASDPANSLGGQLYQEDLWQGSNQPSDLLQETLNYYPGVDLTYGNLNQYQSLSACDSSVTSVYVPCMLTPLATKTTHYEGNGNATNAPWEQTTYTYDDLNTTKGYVSGGYHNLLQEVTTSSNAPTITQKWTYQPTNQTINGWTYYTVDKAIHSEIDDSNGHVWGCQDTTYDEGAPSGVPTPDAGLATTVKTYSTCGTSSTAMTSYTAYDQYGNAVGTVDPVAAANPSFYSSNGCTLNGAVNLSTSWTAGRFTSCTTYDTTHTAALPITQTNVLGQATSTAYDYTSGAMPTSTTDINGQTTSYGDSYDSNGNETISASAPNESSSYTTRQTENSTCTSSSTLPCYEIDTNSSLYPNAVSRTFYDSEGRAVETRTPGPTPGDDTVVMTVYNDQWGATWQSEPFQVADGSGWLDPATATDINQNKPAGTTTYLDALGRSMALQDPNFGTTQEPGIACAQYLPAGHPFTSCTTYTFGQATGDSTEYALTTSIDPNGHVTQGFTDALGQVRYTQANSGVFGGTLTVAKQTQTQYNALGKPTAVVVTDEQPQSGQTVTSVTTTMTYDDQGRLLTMNDPDQGNFSYSYDPDGHLIATTQTSGSNSRTIGVNYDLLGRVGCEQTAAPTAPNVMGLCNAGNTLVQNTYDRTYLGSQGSTDFPVGQLTQSLAMTYYPDGTSASVTEEFQHDQRGRLLNEQVQLGLPSSWNVTSALPTYQESMLYNDANQVTTTSTLAGSQGYTFSPVYDPTNGILQGLSNNSNSTANLATLSYNENAQLAGITLLNGASSSPADIASEAFNYDANLRPTSLTANWLPGSSNSGQILAQSRSYDNASNVTSVNTTFAAVSGQSGSGGMEVQNFCYDEQNRLIWAGNGGTQPGTGTGTCGTGTLSNSMSGGSYTAPFSYTNLGQIWQGPLNGTGSAEQYLYCNNAPHELTGVYPTGTTCANKGSATAVYTASYDPWGNENVRSYQGVTASLYYDAFNRLVEYNAGSTSQEFYAYDPTGNRVLKRSTTKSGTTIAVYTFGGLEEYDYSSTGTLAGQIRYYSLAGHLIGEFNGSTTVYNLTDGLGSILATFSQSAVIGEQVFGPYGNQRYGIGTIGTPKGYTGQIHDSVSGLDYYNARYYDPVAGVFLSPDNVQGNTQGMDPYAYVGGNPETRTDPTGQRYVDGNGDSAWFSNGLIYEQQVGSRPTIIGHTKKIQPVTVKQRPSQLWMPRPTSHAPSCPGKADACGAPGVTNPGYAPSLLEQSGTQLDNSDELVGSWQGIFDQLQILFNWLILQAQQAGGSSTNVLGQLSGAFATLSGAAAVAAALLTPIGDAAAGLVLTGSILSAAFGGISGVQGFLASTGSDSPYLNYANKVNTVMTSMSQFKKTFTEGGGDINKITFTVREVDRYGTMPTYGPGVTSDYPIVVTGSMTDWGTIASAAFSMDYYYKP